ncbi:glycosyl hydrolase [Roseovarius sp. C7]|uniref:glycosyl hydrolase n=1 Tax=Roseovarius sp. C7 TaxID=3398643 RepID=UPI0039F67668
MRQIATAIVIYACLAGTALAQKAGVGAWENSRYTMLDWIEQSPGLGWYYNWRADHLYAPGRRSRQVEFVPMIHGAKDVAKPIKSAGPVRALLGFNEPDGRSGSHQSSMSVEQAIRLWPRLMAKGLRLGSPATTQDGTLGRGSWQRQFMDQVEARGLRVDFMAVHYYSRDGDVGKFKRWLHAVHREYRRPIWVTEFALVDWARPRSVRYRQSADFAQAAIEMMERLPFVERHAWFAANPYSWKGAVPQINLVADDLSPTPTGRRFDEVVGRLGGRQVAARQ